MSNPSSCSTGQPPPQVRASNRLVANRMNTTVSDMVIRDLALSEADLLNRLAAAESDRRVYRELAQQALHALARLRQERDQAQATVLHLRDELRRYCASQASPERAA